MKKKLLSILLAAIMVVGLLPTMAFAEVADCEYDVPAELTEGPHGLCLGGCDKGKFTFTPVGGGWSIQKDGKYLAVAEGELILRDDYYVWAYQNGAFSTTAKTTQKTNGRWLGFLYIPGSTKTVDTTYYLSAVEEGAKLSTRFVSAKLYDTNNDGENHTFGDWIDCKNGNHKHVCTKCGETETAPHSFGDWRNCEDGIHHEKVCADCGAVEYGTHSFSEETCGACGADKPYVDFDIDVIEEPTKQLKYVGIFPFGRYKQVQTYTADIDADGCKGIKVCMVEYQVNESGKWTIGTRVSSADPITSLKVRALGSNGKWYYNGEVAMTVGDILDTYVGTEEFQDETFPTVLNQYPWSNGDDGVCGILTEGSVLLFADESKAMTDEPPVTVGIPLAAKAVKVGNNWKYTNGTETFTFNMGDDVLTSITVADGDSALNGTYSRKMNVMDVLKTYAGGFPNSEATALQNDIDAECYYNDTDGVIYFTYGDGGTEFVDVILPVTADGSGNWTCELHSIEEGGTVKFNMESNALTSITVSECTGDYANLNGEYNTEPK